MKPAPRPLVVLHPDRLLRDRLQRVARRRFHLTTVDDWDDLREVVAEAPPAAVIVVDPYHGQEGSDEPSPQLKSVLKAYPSATVVAALETPPERYRDLGTMGEWGIAEILQVDEDVSSEAIRKRLLSARSAQLRHLLTHDYGVPLTGRARALLDAAVGTVMAGGHPRDLARELDFSPSTLLRWCQRSQLPNPRRLLLWMRILFASALLDDPGHSVYTVGVACGYSGDQALRRAIRSVVPYTPSELREKGAFDTVSRAFFEDVAELRDDRAEKR